MNQSTKGYIPEQVAIGNLDNGKQVVILYIKEYKDQLNILKNAGQVNYFYTWSYIEETASILMIIYWENDVEIAVAFSPKQHSILDSLKMPKEMVITSLPIKQLVEKAQSSGKDFFDLEDSVILSDVTFNNPNNNIKVNN